MARAKGSRFWDVDGNQYIDYLAAYGPLVLGHAPDSVMRAIRLATEDGILYGTPTPWETEFAESLKAAIPELDKVRFTNSGTEAVMTTVRIARGVTGRTKIVKFAGCYHGHADLMLVAAGSGPSSMGIPDSAGVTKRTAEEVITIPFNDLSALATVFDRYSEDIAAVIVEPVVGNFGIVPPSEPGYLQAIVDEAHRHGALVIFDEVITAFRFHYGTAASLYNARPDLYALGKIIGGGLPIGAYGGRQDIMESVAPLGPVYQAGTMAGNPLSMRAGIACLAALREPGLYQRLDGLGHQLETAIVDAANQANIPVTVNRVGGAFSISFGNHTVTDYEGAKKSNDQHFSQFFHALLQRGINTAPSKFEAWFVSAAHTEEDIEITIEAIQDSFKEMSVTHVSDEPANR